MSLIFLSMIMAAVVASAPPEAATPFPGNKLDIARFTIDGIGLSSSPEEVKRALGAPDEERKIVQSEEARKALEEEEEKEERPIEKRQPEKQFNRIIYEYLTKGIQITFDERDMSIYTIEAYIAPLPPYEKFKGSFVQPISLPVRESQLLRPLAEQIYKDANDVLYLKKDDAGPLRETAVLWFTAEGWLSKIAFRREENFVVDVDGFCAGGVCLGDTAKKALDTFGSPDGYGARRDMLTASWDREGIRIRARRDGGRIYRISIIAGRFDGGFVQPLTLAHRKAAFHDYFGSRIYQESSRMICAYKKGQPRSLEKVILKFDDDDRLKSITFETIGNVEIDLENMTVKGVRVGDTAQDVVKTLGRAKRWRDMGDSLLVGYPGAGVRVIMKKNVRKKWKEGRGVVWPEVGVVERIEMPISLNQGFYSVPMSLAETRDDYGAKYGRYIFRERKDVLYLSADGRPPSPGVALVINFEKTGWPHSMTFREFHNIIVDLRKYTVAGLKVGSSESDLFETLGKPQRTNVIKEADLAVYSYPRKGIIAVIDRKDRKLCKLIVDMQFFEGSFTPELPGDADADDIEKIIHDQIYKQDERTFWITPDGKAPTWEEGVIEFGFTGDLKRVTFHTLGVKKWGILHEITKELE